MNSKRSQAIAAAALLLGTAVAGAAARATWRGDSTHGNQPARVSAADGRVRFSGTFDRNNVQLGQDGVARLELVMHADDTAPLQAAVRRPTDLVIVLDRSGSMDGSKMEDARAAVRELLAQLDENDRFALVVYSDSAQTVIPLSPNSAARRDSWSAILSGLQTMGGTNMASGLDLGLAVVEQNRVADRVPRLILISDGLANQGDASPEGLTARARRAARGEYMLSTVGIGADFNEYLMTALADAGTGNYYYVQTSQSLAEIFAREFDGARSTVASGLAVRVQPAAGVRLVDAAGYPLEPDGDALVFRPGSLFAGQERRVWLTFDVPHDSVGEYDVARVALSYNEEGKFKTLALDDLPRIACVQGREQFLAGIDRNAWGRSVTVEAYNKMQDDVAREVSAGRRDAALQRLREFKDETAALNAAVQSAPVAAQLKEADRLESEVEGAFVGESQKQRQNELSKRKSYDALDYRRAGSKK